MAARLPPPDDCELLLSVTIYPILIAVMVLSFELPVKLNFMTLVVAVSHRHEIFMLEAGAVRKPDREIVVKLPALKLTPRPESMTVVPSHNLHKIRLAAAVSPTVTLPLANHVPDEPCATLGPSK